MNFSSYNNNQQQHGYDYDPSSQIQPYDQSYSYQSYYAYNHQYAYFPTHAHAIPDTHQPHLQFQHELAPVHPPGVNPPAPEPAPTRATHAPTGPSQYRGRGGRTFRGGGRGRRRGLNDGRHFPSHSSGPVISNVADAPAAAGATSVVQPSSSFSGQTPPKPAQVPAAPLQPPPRSVWCEICKVECNTPEVLEQHKNGKRHKKNMKAHEELQRRKAIHEQQSGLIPSAPLNLTDQPKQAQGSEKKGCPAENMSSEVTADNHKGEEGLQNNMGGTSEVPAEEPAGKSTVNSTVRGRGLKRKMRGGRGGKYMRSSDGSRRPVEPPKPQQATSFICELCNVKCESQVVYHSHLNGKKHLSSLKRVHGDQALAGFVGLQSLYPPDINALANSINAQVQQGVNDPQVLLAQLLMTLLSQAQAPAIAPTSGAVAAQIPATTSVAESSYEPQLSQTQVSEITARVEMENATGETKNQLLSVPLEVDALASSINALSNTINAQIQQGVTDPQVLLAQLLMTLLSQAQAPAIALPSGPVAAQIPAPTSLAGSSYGPQLMQTQVSEITAHEEIENPTGETKNQLSSVPLELDALACSSSGTQIAGGSSETKQVLKHPQDGSGMTPADNSGPANDQIPSECEASTS